MTYPIMKTKYCIFTTQCKKVIFLPSLPLLVLFLLSFSPLSAQETQVIAMHGSKRFNIIWDEHAPTKADSITLMQLLCF